MASLKQAVTIIKAGGVVVYPTESYWALGADATNPAAVRRVFELKRRERKPIALIAGNWQQVERFFTMTKRERSIARRYWPGALTMLLKPKGTIAADALLGTTPPGRMTGHPSSPGLSSRGRRGVLVGVRVPAHAQARELALTAGVPLTATSANLSGHPPTKSLPKVKNIFPDLMMLNGLCGRQRLPSTVIEVRENRRRTIRPGAVKVNDHV